MGAIMISRNQIEAGSSLVRLPLDRNIYVDTLNAKMLQVGKSYVLWPTENTVGRIASKSLLDGGSAVSADHCQTKFSDSIYEIYEVTASGGRRKTRKSIMTSRHSSRKHRNNHKSRKQKGG